jgi:hypothetical protein
MSPIRLLARRVSQGALVSFAAITLTGIAMSTVLTVVLVALAGVGWAAATHTRMPDDWLPTDMELAAIDARREREEREAFEESGEGARHYEELLLDLSSLVGHDITAVIRAGGPPRDSAIVSGVLRAALPIHGEEDEALVFTVGDLASGFHIYRAPFVTGEAVAYNAEDDGLFITAPGVTIEIHEHATMPDPQEDLA